MKHVVRMACLLSALMLVLQVLPAASFSRTFVKANSSQAYTIDVPYSYPVDTNSPKWSAFRTTKAMREACQIPEDILYNMSTVALLRSILNYPLLQSYFTYNDIGEYGYVLMDVFNAFPVFFSRDDAWETLMGVYSITNNDENFFAESDIEFLFLCYKNICGLDDVSEDQFLILNSEKIQERIMSGEYSCNTDIYNSSSKAQLVSVISGNRSPGSTWVLQPNGTVKTPNQTNVPSVYTRSPAMTVSERNALNQTTDSQYPLATRIYTASVAYNCHSYAWYNSSPTNPYWISSAPSVYFTDGSYVLYSGIPYSGIRAWYNGQHSAIYTGEPSLLSYYVESKWGMAGVYHHSDDYGPYAQYAITKYKRNN